jgi:PAS domain S-box-containing protein
MSLSKWKLISKNLKNKLDFYLLIKKKPVSYWLFILLFLNLYICDTRRLLIFSGGMGIGLINPEDKVFTDDLNNIGTNGKYLYSFFYLGKGIFLVRAKGYLDEKSLKHQIASGDIARERLYKLGLYNKYHLVWDASEVIGVSLLARRLMFFNAKSPNRFESVSIIGASIFARNYGRILSTIIPNFKINFFRSSDAAIQNIEKHYQLETSAGFPKSSITSGAESYSVFIDLWQEHKQTLTVGNKNYKYVTKPEWIYASSDDSFKANIYVIEGNIVYYRLEGFAKSQNIEKTYKILESIIAEFHFNNTDNKFYSVLNLKKLKGISLAARKRTVFYENLYHTYCNFVIAIPSYLINLIIKIVVSISPSSFYHWESTSSIENAFERVAEHKFGKNLQKHPVKPLGTEKLVIPGSKTEMIELIKRQYKEIEDIKQHQKEQIRKILEVTGRMTWDESFVIPVNTSGNKSPFDEIFDSLAILLSDFKEIIRDKTLHAKLLEESEEKYKNLIDLASDIIVVYQEDAIKFVNSRVYQLLGYTVEEVLGNSMQGFVAPEEIPRLQEYYRKRVAGDIAPWIYETVIINKEGQRVPISMSVGRIIYEGRPAVMLIARDITQKKKNEEELDRYRTHLEEIIRKRTEQLQKEMTERKVAEESDKLKTAFLSNMSHEIRTPMNAIIAFSNFLKDAKITEKQKNEYIDFIISSGQSLLNLINDIIDISKIESKQLDIQNEITSIDPLLQELFKIYDETCKNVKKGKVALILKKPENENILLDIDRQRLRQILTNLLDNALKFTQTGYVEFGYNLTNKDVVFYVKDTGTGIPEDKIEFIFKRFGRLNTTKVNAHGAGLGLAICKHLAHLLNGKIWVESEVENGSTFYLKIPGFITSADYKAEEVNKEDPKDKYVWKGKTILIAEDEDLNFRVLQIALSKTGANIIRAATGVEAVNTFNAQKDIHIILMDIQMPEMDGYEAMFQIKKVNSSMPIIAQTAFALLEEKKKCIDMGFDDYIAKPIKLDELMQKIEKHLQKRN